MRRVFACLAALLVAWAVPLLAAAPTLGQHLACTNSGTTCTTALTGLTTGSGLLGLIAQSGNDVDTAYSVADGAINTYGEWTPAVVRNSADMACDVFIAHNITTTAGALTPVVTQTNGPAAFRVEWVEVLGMATSSAVDVTGSLGESGNNTSHPMASPGLTTLSDIFMAGVAGTSGTNATYAAATDFTSLTGDFSSTVATAQYLSSATARSSETATWTNGTGRNAANCLIAVKSASSAVGVSHLGVLVGAGH